MLEVTARSVEHGRRRDYEECSQEGKPFVGPAGKLFDKAMEEAGVDRSTAYVTNVVKHFKWKAQGKRRIHQKPSWSQVAACLPWLEAELALVKSTRARLPRRHGRPGSPRSPVPGDAAPR